MVISDTADTSKKRHLLKQRFQVIKKLGQGTYGKVQLAINKESGQEVAIKTIRKSMVETEQDLVRIRREITIMSSIQHPHIIHIYEVFENKDKIVLVMQFAPGGELYEYLSERKVFDDLEARRIFRQISSAIYYCHKNHICHRDLKLENILIDEKGNAKIGDFGLSNVFDEKHFLSTFCGSPLYASPEIVKGAPYYGPEVDCWSLGVLLYTLVYGAMPFDGSNFKRLVKQISESNYYEPANKSGASSLIRKLLNVDPKKRATIVNICTDEWVNSGFDNCLLQVSEDLANLTPVRLDILLSLAPLSPTSPSKTKEKITLSGQKSDETSKPGEKASQQPIPSTSTGQSGGAPSSSSTTSKRRKSVKTNSSDSPPPKKSENEYKPDASQSDETTSSKTFSLPTPTTATSATTLPAPMTVTDVMATTKSAEATNEDIQTATPPRPGMTKRKPSLAPTVVSRKNSIAEVSPSTVAATTKTTPGSAERMRTAASSKATASEPAKADDLQAIAASATATPEVVSNAQTSQQPTDSIPPSNEMQSNNASCSTSETCPAFSSEGGERKDSITASEKEVLPDTGSSEKSELAESNIHSPKTPLSKQISLDSNAESNTSLNGESRQKPPPLERRSSSVASRKVGRLSIPNFLELQERSPALKKPVPSYGSIEDAKKKLLERKDSTASETKEPEHVFPTIPVAEVKQDVERRASTVEAPTLTKGPQGIRFNSLTNEDEIIRGKKKVMERRSTEPLAMFRTEIKTMELKEDGDSQQPQLQHSFTTGNKDKEMTLAKEVLKKQLAANIRMAEHRRQSSEGKNSFKIPEAVSESPELVSSPSPIKEETEDEIRKRSPQKSPIKSPEGRETIPTLQQQQSLLSPTPGSMPVIKPAPITRSYKKVTFRKDGACITETGKVYSTEGPDGKITRVEKKSKVTHYPSTASETPLTELTETNQEQLKHSADDQCSESNYLPSNLAAISAAAATPSFAEPFKSSSKSSLRKSESMSSSGSTDIFDDIFDTWSGDNMFNNMISPRLKTLLHPSMFNMKRADGGRRKGSSRAESCDRRDSTSMTPGSLLDSDEDPSSTFAATASPFAGGMFKLNSQSLLDRHRNMFSDFFSSNPSDSAFSNNDNFIDPHSLSSRSGRERATSSASAPRNTSMGRGVATTRSRPSSMIRGSFDSSGDPDNYCTVTTPRSSISSASKPSPYTQSPFIRTVSNTPDGSFEKQDESESEDSVSSRKRVEQWLHMSPTDRTMDANNPYATVRRPLSRYARTLSARHSQDLSDDITSTTDEDDLARLKTRGRPISLQLRMNLGTPSPSPVRSRQVYKPSSVYSDSRLSGPLEEPVTVPEASTLLQQLQMHGYKNLVNQQIVFGPDKKFDDGPLAGQPYRKDFNTINSASCNTPTNSNQTQLTDSPTNTTTNGPNKKPPLVTSAVSLDIGPSLSTGNNDDQPCSSTQPVPTNGDTQQPDPTTPTSPSEETVKERIHRKSYYSRFNDEPIRRSSSLTPQMYDWPNFRQS